MTGGPGVHAAPGPMVRNMIAIMIENEPGGEMPQKPPHGVGGIAVSVDALSLDGERPEVGDEVDIQATARVASVDGAQAVLEITSVNGEPSGPPKPEKPEPPSDDEVRNRMMEVDGWGE